MLKKIQHHTYAACPRLQEQGDPSANAMACGQQEAVAMHLSSGTDAIKAALLIVSAAATAAAANKNMVAIKALQEAEYRERACEDLIGYK